MRSMLMLVGGFIASFANADVATYTGIYTMNRYNSQGEIRNTTEGSFELSYDNDYFRIRALNPSDTSERGILVISNYEDIYQCDKMRSYKNSSSAKTAKHSFAFFQKGIMPNAYDGWGAIQNLALAFHLTKPPINTSERFNLGEGLIPDIISRRLRELKGTNFSATVIRNTAGTSLEVKFECDRPQKETKTKIGLLRIENPTNTFPAKFSFLLYAENENYIATVDYEVRDVTKSDPSIFKEIAYDARQKVAVTDHRNLDNSSGNKKFQYILDIQDNPPFNDAGNLTYKRIINELNEGNARIKNKRTREYVSAAGILFVLGGMVFFVTRQKLNKQQTTK